MAPLVPMFDVATLPDHVNTVTKNYREKRRKGPQVNLTDCPLFEMVQYSCNPPQKGVPSPGQVVCTPIVRLFRRCANGLTVETTAWEPIRLAEEEKAERARLEATQKATA